jgi:hypothetical protein
MCGITGHAFVDSKDRQKCFAWTFREQTEDICPEKKEGNAPKVLISIVCYSIYPIPPWENV